MEQKEFEELISNLQSVDSLSNPGYMKWLLRLTCRADESEPSLLYYAILYNDFSAIRFLLQNGMKADAGSPDAEGAYAVHLAVHNMTSAPYYDAYPVEGIINSCDNVNIADGQKVQALHYAIEYQNFRAIRAFLHKGADVDLQDNNGQSAIHKIFHFDISGAEQQEIIAAMFQKSEDLNLRDNNWQTPLHICIKQGCFGAAQFLIEQRVNFKIQDKDGNSAAHILMFDLDIPNHQKLEILNSMLKHGPIGLTLTTKEGLTLLDIALDKAREDLHHSADGTFDCSIIEFLIAAGARVDLLTEAGWEAAKELNLLECFTRIYHEQGAEIARNEELTKRYLEECDSRDSGDTELDIELDFAGVVMPECFNLEAVD